MDTNSDVALLCVAVNLFKRLGIIRGRESDTYRQKHMYKS